MTNIWLLLDSRLIFYDYGCFACYLPRRGCVFQPRVVAKRLPRVAAMPQPWAGIRSPFGAWNNGNFKLSHYLEISTRNPIRA
ncbi:MAG: hypothetical protein BECKG1743D_GA0114223_100873 [Candidatus Kentron sp. G]|nr:MAG: hypothetical protein BECKG1743D_GA0114223_100873 [Candidatus Kentron sp. G]